jgi:hypothetical protein
MAEEMVRDRASNHGFTDGDRANTDAGIMPSFGDHVDFFSASGDASPRGED